MPISTGPVAEMPRRPSAMQTRQMNSALRKMIRTSARVDSAPTTDMAISAVSSIWTP